MSPSLPRLAPPNSITGCVPLLEFAHGWTILHDPAAHAVFACRHHSGSGCCRARYHHWPSVCTGPAYRYGGWLIGRRSPGQAFDACAKWITETQQPTSQEGSGDAEEELAARVEIYRLMENL